LKIKPWHQFIIFTIICEIFTFFLLVRSPSDIENQLLLGFSLNRWVFIIFVLLCFLTSIVTLTISYLGKSSNSTILRFLEFPTEKTTIVSFLLTIIIAGSFSISFLHVFPDRFFIARLRPLILMVLLITSGYTLYLIIFLHHNPLIKIVEFMKNTRIKLSYINEKVFRFVQKFYSGYWFLGFTLILSFPLLFFTAFKYSFPSGFAGLYTLMADAISESGFQLPQFISFYGPGSMPFAYPPVGFYLMAFFTSVFNIPNFIYLRFAPPIFMWLSLIPLALLTFEISKSRSSAIIASVIVATAQRIFIIQGTSGGIVRGLAFLFAFLGLYFFMLSLNPRKNIRFSLLSGLFIGLTALTHLSYVEFVLLFLIAYFFTHIFSKRVWRTLFIAGGVAMSFVLPWVFIMVHRYGWTVFLRAFQSHGNDYFFSLFTNPQLIIPWFENSLRPIFGSQFVWGMIVLALIYSFFSSNIFLSIWFFLLLIFTSEGDRFLISTGAILIGSITKPLFNSLRTSIGNVEKSWKPILFLIAYITIFYQYGWQSIAKSNEPVINSSSLEVANYIRTNTPDDYTYLIVAQADEAEWFPYLLQRVPVVASWGGEWKGTYSQHLGWIHEVIYCKETGSLRCLEKTINQLPIKPDLLITHADDIQINSDLQLYNSWNELFKNEKYVIWSRN